MAEKYCDHGAYGAYAAVPTWGQAQDGDGTAKAVGTPSTASVVFTGVPSSGVIAVLGQTITFTRATSADVCANNLATAINASTATATGPASFTTLSQVRNHLYARGPANGAPAGTCEIMTRQASASHAGLICATHTLNNVSSPGTINFAGGSGGCWGYIGNTDVLWPSALAAPTYGIFTPLGTFAGAMQPGDVAKVRSGKVLTFPSGPTNVDLTLGAIGTAEQPVRFDIDDSTEWADGPFPVLVLERETTGNTGSWSFASQNNTSFVHLRAQEYPGGIKSMQFRGSFTGTSRLLVSLRSAALADHVEFWLTTALGSMNIGTTSGHLVSLSPNHRNCRFRYHGNSSLFVATASAVPMKSQFQGSDFVAEGAVSATAVVSSTLFASTQPRRYSFDACRFIGFVPGSTLFPVGGGPAVDQSLVLKNCEMGNVRVVPSFLNSSSSATGEGMRGVYAASQTGTRDFTYEDAGWLFAEWRYSAGRPTLNAKLFDGVTPWAIYAVPCTVAGRVSPLSPVTLPRISKLVPSATDMAQAQRTFTFNFLLESSLSAWTRAEISALIEYVDADGVLRTLDTYDHNAAPLQVSSAGWTSTDWNGQSWLKRQISVTTPHVVRGGDEVVIYLRLHSSVVNDTQGVILDPEVLVA